MSDFDGQQRKNSFYFLDIKRYITEQTVERARQQRGLSLQPTPLDILGALALSRLLTVVIGAAASVSGGSGSPLHVKVRLG